MLPLADVPTRSEFNLTSALSGFALGAVLTVIAVVAFVPVESSSTPVAAGVGTGLPTQELDVSDDPGTVVGGTGGGVTNTTAAAQATGGGGRSGVNVGAGGAAEVGSGGQGGDLKCQAGQNGGATEKAGVTATEIKLGATKAETGIAEAFLGEVRQAMEAVKNRTNRAGGVCGRQLSVEYLEDGWDAGRGQSALENLIKQKNVFAIAVAPSSEGVNQAALAGLFKETGVPVVGADGLVSSQYTDPFIWPVAAATTTTMHIMMKDAWERAEAAGKALEPAIVFENTYRFGVEGALAFNNAYKRLSNKDIPGFYDPTGGGPGACSGRFCGIPAGKGQYGTEVNALNQACGTTCNFLAILLEPKTAQDWMAVAGVKEPEDLTFGIGAAQPLFTFEFGRNCGDKCHQMLVWTGYNPPIEKYRTSAAVQGYVSALHAQSATADEFNQFTQGGYLGMTLLVDALKKVGPNLTREALKDALDSMTLTTGLSQPLTWASGNHFANKEAQAFRIESKNGFTGWTVGADYKADPWLGQDAG